MSQELVSDHDGPGPLHGLGAGAAVDPVDARREGELLAEEGREALLANRPLRGEKACDSVALLVAREVDGGFAVLVQGFQEALRASFGGRVHEEVFGYAQVATEGGEVKGCLTVGVGLVDGQTQVVEQADDLQIALVRGPVERRVLEAIEDTDIGTYLHQVGRSVRLAPLRRHDARRAPLVIPRVDVGARVDERAHARQSTLGAGPVQRPHADLVVRGLVHRGAPGQERLQERRVPPPGRPVSQSVSA